ncbi:hypothetical protein ACTG9Q_07305 [Actinokineospora sp. 24-640]
MRLITAAVMALAATALTGGVATADPVRGAGQVWASNPASASYTPPTNYQMNSTGPGVTNTITRSGTGVYAVRFTGLGVTGGVAHATAYGAGTGQCKVGSWHPSAGDQLVTVRCFTLAGVPVDSMFTASYTNRTTWRGFDGAAVPGAYLWAGEPTSANYTPSAVYQYNSSGAVNTVSRTGTGTYRVYLPGIGHSVTGGHPLVTAYGSGSERCKVVSHGWTTPSSTIQVNVRCFTTAGAPTDARFTLTFTDRTNVLGLEGRQSAYALAHDETAASYTPAASYLHVTQGGTATATRVGVGVYVLNPTGVNLGAGSVHTSASGWDGEFCKVIGWGTGGVTVRCYDNAGALTDTPYTLSFTGP